MTASSDPATRERSRVALVTGEAFPDLWVDDHPLRDALRARSVAVDTVRWDDEAADWSAYDLVVIRSPWDYPARRDAFVAWAHRVPRLANPAGVVEWNTDKHYLRDLAAAGRAVTPTTFVEPGEPWEPPASGDWVVKPAISVNSRNSGRYRLPQERDLAVAHVAGLSAAGRSVMIQPYLTAVDTAGETSVIFLPSPDGGLHYSHAVRKGPLLSGPDLGDAGASFDHEPVTARQASLEEVACALRALAVVPGGPERLLYARVDLMPGPDGLPLVAELELTEPSLFLLHAPGAAEQFADAILTRLRTSG